MIMLLRYPYYSRCLVPDKTAIHPETRYEEGEQNTAGLVFALMVGVGFVFGSFATAALCYRSAKLLIWVECVLQQLVVLVVKCRDCCAALVLLPGGPLSSWTPT